MHKRIFIWSIVFIFSALHYTAGATTLTVSLDGASSFTVIQSAIDAAVDGDTVVVTSGTYLENLQFNGKNITLQSSDPTSLAIVQSTIIDGNITSSVITFSGAEGTTCILTGLTITNGSDMDGGGINGNHCVATIRGNRIVANFAYRYGGGLYACDGLIEGNLIAENEMTEYYMSDTGIVGAGLCDCDGVIRNNIVAVNSCRAT
ncbi:hypothetical protein JXA32_03565 [Candidatus Sumerlaeota bacterium]|nr:hypothetical protein [Candidatus Sumerlaeota bacterium]